MTDYHPLIARAVDGLAKNTGEARRSLYERARAALVAQLRAVQPALSESDITKERLALEEAIRKVESEAARKALAEPRPQVRNEPRPRAGRAETRLDQRVAAASPRGSAAGMRPPLDLAAAMRRERPNAVAADLPAAGGVETPQAEPPQPIQREGDPAQADAPAPTGKSTARSRILEARTSTIKAEGLKGFRNVVNAADGLGAATAKAAQTARDTRDSYAPPARPRSAASEDVPPRPPEQFQPHFDEEELQPVEDELLHLHSLEPSYDLDEVEPMPASRSLRPHAPRIAEYEEGEEEYEQPSPPRSYRGWAKFALLLIIVLGLTGTGWAYRSNIAGIYHFFTQTRSQPPAQTAQNPPPVSKFSGRVPEEQVPGQAPSTGTNPGSTEQGPTVAQRAVLYEADPNDPQGKRFAGSVVWRTETVSPGPGLAPELAVRADISIPERHMTVTWSLRRNTDKALPASHTIEIMFNLPPDFPGGGISNVPGILMKDSEEVRGMPLAGLAVKVTNGFFLIGLNAADADIQRNIQLLKERSWFDILIVYNNGSRAILTMEKGPPGERAFADAFKAWGQ
jgi:hypothetical protein